MTHSNQFPTKQRRPRSRKGVTLVRPVHTLMYFSSGPTQEIMKGNWGLLTTRMEELKNDPRYKGGTLKII